MTAARSWLALAAAVAAGCSGGGDRASSGDGAAAEGDAGAAAALSPRSPFRSVEPPPEVPPDATGSVRVAYRHVAVDVDGDIATTTVTEVLVNDLDAAIEASFGFPLPDDASVTDFAEWVDGARRAAAIGAKDDARAAFDRAAARGEAAALAEENDGRRFEMRLAALAPGDARRVELVYVQTVPALAGERTYVFPARRTAEAVPTLFDLEVAMRGDRDIVSARALNHEDARITRVAADRWTAHLSRTRAPLASDFAVSWRQPAEDIELAARAVRRGADEPGFVEARLAFNRDPRPDEREPMDVVVVLDRSLSMAGEPLARAQEIADDIVAGVLDGDRIGLVSFADDVRVVELSPAGAAHRARVVDEIASMGARGHSNLAAALDEAAAMLSGAHNPLVVLLSDGQPTEGDGVEEPLPASRAADVRGARAVVALFNYPSRVAAVEQLFPAATVRFVPDGAAGDDVAGQLVSLAVAPVIEDLVVEVAGAEEGTVHPAAPERLAMGESLRIVARASASVTVRARGTLRGAPISIEREVAVPADPGRSRAVATEWARARIRDLQRRYDGGEHELAAEIRELGTEYRLATTFTSFVRADSLSPDRIKPGDPEIRVRAPRNAARVFAVLPWGEVVSCRWQDDEELWLGRFLAPRALADGLYRVRVFVEDQSGVSLRSTLPFRIDSAPPRFELDARWIGGELVVEARAVDAVFDGAGGDSVRLDRVDVRRVWVTIDGHDVDLELGDDGVFTARAALALAPGRHDVVLTAVDYAANSSQVEAVVDVRRGVRR